MLLDLLIFPGQNFIATQNNSKGKFTRKLSRKDISDIEAHFQSEDISFLLPDKKYTGKRFMRQSVKKSLTMYNLLSTTTRQISLSTYYRYKLQNVKFQGKIPFQQSCCEKYQNVENKFNEACKYMKNVP